MKNKMGLTNPFTPELCWSLLRHLETAIPPLHNTLDIDLSQVTERLQNITRQKHKKSARQSLHDFAVDEFEVSSKKMKLHEAPGYENVIPEFLNHSGIKAKIRLTELHTSISNSENIQTLLRVTKVIEI
ncbi:hypothetical protein JTB14_009725 [Gonioctena quinquepunctata]|nr:hypothetical protein JTB14_009725 [Gonioctena quinquepunctata]